MKRILLLLLVVSTSMLAQERTQRKHMYKELSSEQRAQLASKRLALNLDLNDAQIKKVTDLNVDTFKKREAITKKYKENKESLTSDDKYNMMMEMLDIQIATSRQMKTILDKEQYSTWKSRQNKMKSKMMSKKRKGHQKESHDHRG